MYSEGAFGSGSEPRANLIAISHVPATDRYKSDDAAVSTSCAMALSLSSAATPQRNTLVSSRYFMPSSWLFSRAFSFVLRIDQASPRAKAHQNPLGRSAAREESPGPAATSRAARGPGGPPEPRGWRWQFPRPRPP